MKNKVKRTLTLTVEGEDIDKLRSAVKKVNEEINKPGFRSTAINSDEADVLRKLQDNIPE